MTITSRSHPTIKQIRGLRERKNREQSGLFFAEGIRIVAEAVQVGAAIEHIVVAPSLLRSEFGQGIVAAQQRAGVACLEVSGDVFESISTKEKPQGLGAVVRQRCLSLDEMQPDSEPWWIALSGVQDPGNLGSILRTGDAVGTAGVLLVGQTTDPFAPEAVRASMGAIFSQRIVRTTLGEIAAWKAAHQFVLVGTSDAAATDYQARTCPSRLNVCMGSEQHGLSGDEQSMRCDGGHSHGGPQRFSQPCCGNRHCALRDIQSASKAGIERGRRP